MTATTATMTLSPPPRIRVSDSTPPFLLQKRHGPPPYFLQRIPTTIPQSGSTTPPLRQKRSFTLPVTRPELPSDDLASVPPKPPQPGSKPAAPGSSSSPARAKTPTRSVPSVPLRALPAATPPPEKALPPIPFPSRSSPPPFNSSSNSRNLLVPGVAHAPSARPVSQDEEETLRQLEQLAAELKQMDPGALATANQRRSREPPHRRQRKLPCKPAHPGPAPSANLEVPRIVVTNASTENLAGAAERAKSPEVDGGSGSGDVSDEELWVDQYGGWGTSEKGKWKASPADEEADAGSNDELASSPPVAHSSRPATPSNPAEVFYIYEPIGAPEFLAGSSTSPIARATDGYHSRRATSSSSKQKSTSVHRRRRRPAALVLATPEQAEWYTDAVLGSAPPLPVPRPLQTPLFIERPLTAPQSTSKSSAHSVDAQTPSSARLPPRRAMSSDTTQSPTAREDEASHILHPRRSESLAAMARMPSQSALRDSGGRDSQAVSWIAPALQGTSSVPNSPRQGARPRLKSFKGLFKHFSTSK